MHAVARLGRRLLAPGARPRSRLRRSLRPEKITSRGIAALAGRSGRGRGACRHRLQGLLGPSPYTGTARVIIAALAGRSGRGRGACRRRLQGGCARPVSGSSRCQRPTRLLPDQAAYCCFLRQQPRLLSKKAAYSRMGSSRGRWPPRLPSTGQLA